MATTSGTDLKDVDRNGDHSIEEKMILKRDENGDLHLVAERGHAATDKYGKTRFSRDFSNANEIRYGRSLFTYDRAAESKLRLKIDLYTIPTVSLIYLFCFIDRANIGMRRQSYMFWRH